MEIRLVLFIPILFTPYFAQNCGMNEFMYPIQQTVLVLDLAVIDVPTLPRRKSNLSGATTFNTRNNILNSLVIVHAGFVLVTDAQHVLNRWD